MMWWPPYRRRVWAEADELMETYGGQTLNAAARLLLIAHKAGDFRRVRFYRHVKRYVENFVDTPLGVWGRQEPYAVDLLTTEMLNREIEHKTLH